MEQLKQALIVAGTHGNELSGIYLHKLIKENLYIADRSTFESTSIIANPKAVQYGQRYINSDLNREFSTVGARDVIDCYESQLAHQFRESHAKVQNQLIIDLHNTTSNMGATLILLSGDLFYKKMGAYVKQRMPSANILFEDRKAWDEQPYLCTAGDFGVITEVGAQAHGSLKSVTLDLMKQMLTAVLDYTEKHNLDRLGSLSNYSAYYYTQDVDIPLDSDGKRQAMVHPTICGQDFEAVKQGKPLLATFYGYDIYWEGTHDIYPHFINEAAYSKAKIAMALAEKRQVFIDKF